MASGQQSNPLVSICIPCWGEYSKYLKEALESAKSQTYPNVEIIIASGKKTLPSARNEAIKKAKGVWVMPLDADDKLDPRYLEKTVGLNDIVTTFHRDWDGNIGDSYCEYFRRF
jgi:glycosyltransferase involved in cell wall biosynthesis